MEAKEKVNNCEISNKIPLLNAFKSILVPNGILLDNFTIYYGKY